MPTDRAVRVAALLVATLGLLTGPIAVAAGGHGSAPTTDEIQPAEQPPARPASHDTAEAPGVAEGFYAHALTDAQAPTVITFAPGPDATDGLPGTDPPTEDLYYANLAGQVVHVDLAWTPLGPAAVDRTVVADGFNLPLGVAFDDDGTMYVSDSYDGEVADRPIGVVYEVDPDTGEREVIVDGVPNGQHNINHIRFGPDDRLYLPVGNPNDSGNGTGTGHTDIFPYSGAFLAVDVAEVSQDPAILHWEEADGDPIADDDIVDHPRNEDFAEKVDVFAFGFRNIFGITWAPGELSFGGEAYTGTNGADAPNSQDTLERLREGTHHGYPFCVSQGDPGDVDGLDKQLWDGSPHTDFDCSDKPPAEALLGYHVCATGLDFPGDPVPGHPDFSFPEESRSSVFVGECAFFFADSSLQENLEHPSRHNSAHKVTEVSLDDAGNAVDVSHFVEGLPLPTDVQFGPDGAMYIADAGEILRVAPSPLADELAGELVPGPLDDGLQAPIGAVGQSFLPQVALVPTDTTLEWTSGALPHTVTSSASVCSAATAEHCQNNAGDEGSFDGSLFGAADTFRHTFEEPGVFPYFCQLHYALGMTGMVVAVDPEDPGAVGPEDIVDALGVEQAQAAQGHAAHGHGDVHSHNPQLAR